MIVAIKIITCKQKLAYYSMEKVKKNRNIIFCGHIFWWTLEVIHSRVLKWKFIISTNTNFLDLVHHPKIDFSDLLIYFVEIYIFCLLFSEIFLSMSTWTQIIAEHLPWAEVSINHVYNDYCKQ